MKIKTYLLITIALIITTDVYSFGPWPENGCEVTIGPGFKYETLYSGSDIYEIHPYPYIDINYTYNSFQLFAGIKDGIGAKYYNHTTGLFISAGIDMGQSRDTGEEEVKKLLANTPDIKNIISCFGITGWDLTYAELMMRISYFNVTADYDNHNDRRFDAMLYTGTLQSGYPVLDNLLILGTVGVSIMNNEYADAYHEVKYGTTRLKQFNAKGGPESVHGEIMFLYTFNEHFIVRLAILGKRFLGDAHDSPLTQSEYAGETNVTLMYRF